MNRRFTGRIPVPEPVPDGVVFEAPRILLIKGEADSVFYLTINVLIS